MIRFKTLLQLNIKRAFKALPHLIFGAAALIFLVSAVAFCGYSYLYNSASANSNVEPFSIAIVMEDDSKLATTVSEAVMSMSQVNDAVNFVFTTSEEAISQLESNTVIAALVIPKDTAYNIVHGKNTPMTIIFPKNSGIEAVVIKELTDSLSTMLSSSQAGIYSIYDFYELKNEKSQINDALRRMNLKYISLASTGNSMFKETTVSASGSIPLLIYYVSGALVLFSMLFGINCFSFLKNMPANASKRLSQNKVPILMQGLCEYLAVALATLVTLTILIPFVAIVLNLFNLKLELSAIVGLIIILPTFILLSSAIIFTISKITSHNIGRIMITFFLSLCLCFVSGCFIPSIMLPDVIQTISRFTPTYYMIHFSSNIMVSNFDGLSLLMCFIFTVIIFLFGVLYSGINRRKEIL